MKPKMIVSSLFLYLASALISFGTFSLFKTQSVAVQDTPSDKQDDGVLVAVDPEEPKTEVCPLNGQKFTLAEREAWEQRRPLAVMVENSPDARPQSGLAAADVVYEIVAEGGVTRFMAMYLCDAITHDNLIAPLRSARMYFFEIASEYNRPIYSHIGGANCSRDQGSKECTSDPKTMVIEELSKVGWQLQNNIDGMSVGLPTIFRKTDRLGRTVAWEHTAVTSTERLWQLAEKRGFTNTNPDGDNWYEEFVPWKFQDKASSPGDVTTIAYDFWSGYKSYDVRWEFDPTTNTYKRFMGGEPHVDLETGEQKEVSVVIVQKAKETAPLDIHKHLLFDVVGSGEALVFQDGNVIEARWSKPSRTQRTIFTDKTGKEISFSRGKMWISVINTRNTVAY